MRYYLKIFLFYKNMNTVQINNYVNNLVEKVSNSVRPFYQDSIEIWNNIRSQLKLNSKESATKYIYEVEVPGALKEDIKVNIKNNNILLITFDKRDETFSRSIQLPANADSSYISIALNNGLLTINVNKSQDNLRELNIS
jgi:HSP20 family molecular chaperone IbpA